MSILKSFFQKSNLPFQNLESEDFEKMLKETKDSVILDVRTDQEYAEVRLKKSKLIDIYKPNFLQLIDQLDRNKHYFVYCRSGSRSKTACVQMSKMEFKNLYNLADGIIDWHGEVERG